VRDLTSAEFAAGLLRLMKNCTSPVERNQVATVHREEQIVTRTHSAWRNPGFIMNSASKLKLTASAPVLLVRDVVAAANHYRDFLGFHYPCFWGDPPGFVILKRDEMFIMLKQADDPAQVVPHWKVSDKLWNIYFWVSDVEALHAEFVASGATIDYGICDQPYGCREFGIQDLDGHDIGFGQPV
jgi:uncharacterized glyoxalase superfamily protein PhnB